MLSPSAPIAVVAPLAVGTAAILGTVLIHAVASHGIIRFLHREIRRGKAGQEFVRDFMIYSFEAADAMLLFGVSTAFLFAVIHLLVQHRLAIDN
jgi:hypothetical protein